MGSVAQQQKPRKIRRQYIVWLAILQLTTVALALGFYYFSVTNGILTSNGALIFSCVIGAIFIVFNSFVFATLFSRPLEQMQDKLYELNILELSKVENMPLELGKAQSVIQAVNKSLDELAAKATIKKSVAQKVSHHLEALIDQISIGVIVLNADRTISTYNHAAQIILGADADTELGINIVQAMPATMHGQEFLGSWLDEVEKNSATTDVHWVDVELRDDKDNVRYLEIIAHYNKSDTNGLETILLVIDRTAEQQAEDRKVDFIAIAAHELRAPITVIRGYLQVFEDEVSDKLTEEQHAFMRKMHVSAEQLAGFINNILHVSKIETGQISVKHQDTDLNSVISEASEMLQARAEAHERTLELDLSHTLPHVAADINLIPLVINNLVDNGIKYTKADGKVKVTTQYNETDGTVETLVEDNGIGIATTVVGNLFTKFYRSHRSKRQFGGTGIGLYLSKSIIDAHGGKIWVNSTEGKGSTFGFSLPTWESFASSEGAKDNSNEIIQTGHGWIKNHSMYRR